MIIRRLSLAKFPTSRQKLDTASRIFLSADEELDAMFKQELLQTKSDRFWGIDKEIQDQLEELNSMNVEDVLSYSLGKIEHCFEYQSYKFA